MSLATKFVEPKIDGRLDTRPISLLTAPKALLTKLRKFGINNICYLCACNATFLKYFGFTNKDLERIDMALKDIAPHYKLDETQSTKPHLDALNQWLKENDYCLYDKGIDFDSNLLAGVVTGTTYQVWTWNFDYLIKFDRHTVQQLDMYVDFRNAMVCFDVEMGQTLDKPVLWYDGQCIGEVYLQFANEVPEYVAS